MLAFIVLALAGFAVQALLGSQFKRLLAGDHGNAQLAIGGVLATQDVVGLTFGVRWSRTRSFVLVVALHGFIDALANTASFIDTWMR